MIQINLIQNYELKAEIFYTRGRIFQFRRCRLSAEKNKVLKNYESYRSSNLFGFRNNEDEQADSNTEERLQLDVHQLQAI